MAGSSAPQAKFEFVATGDAQVNAQVQGVIDRLVSMKSAAMEAGRSGSEGMLSAKEDVRALGEALEVHIPRPLANIISQFQSLQGVLAGAGIAGAITLGVETAEKLFEKGKEIYDKWLNVDKAVEEYNKQLGEAVTKSAQNALSIEDAESNLSAATDQMNKFAAARMKALERSSNPQSSLDLALGKSEEKDDLTDQLKTQLQIFADQKTLIEQQYTETVNLINAKKQLNDITLQGSAKIKADEQSDIDLSVAKLQKLKDIANVENEMRRQHNAADPAHAVELIPDKVGDQEHDLAVYYAQADALQKNLVLFRQLSESVQSFENKFTDLRNEIEAQNQDDPYQKDLQNFDNAWLKKIRDAEENGEKELDVLRKQGVNTKSLEQELDDTLIAMQKAYYDQRDKLTQEQNQNLLSGGLKSPALPTNFNPLLDQENSQRTEAKTLIEQITNALKDEQAQEQLLKDKAMQAGLSQLTIETQLLALRGASADKIQALVNQLKQLAATMHQGFGDPTITSQADKLGAKIDDLRAKTKTWDSELKKGLNQDLENAFVGIVTASETASQAFQKMAQSILADLAKIVYEMYVVKLLQSALGGIFGGGGSSGGGLPASPDFSNFSFAGTGVVPHALGGPVFPGQTYLVGERGPELFRAGTSGSIVPNSQLRGGGGMTPLQVNIHNYGQPMDQQQTSRFDGKQMVVDIVVKDIQSNGPIRQALKS